MFRPIVVVIYDLIVFIVF